MGYAHLNLSAAARKGYLAAAIRLSEPAVTPAKAQPEQAIHEENPESDVKSPESDAHTQGAPTGTTKYFVRFDVRGHASLVGLTTFLRSVDGKAKSEKVATDMATDVSI